MRRWVYILLLFSTGCSRTSTKINIAVNFSRGNRVIEISGLDKAIMTEIGRDTSNYGWQSLFAVYKMPADTDLKDYQKAQPGGYKVSDSVVVFTPDTSFKKGQLYFLRYYEHEEQVTGWQYLRGKKRPGSLSYKDLVFKY